MYVIRIVARADGTPSEEAGRFIRDFDPKFAAGRGYMTTTQYRHRAKRFADQAAAFAYWRQETPTGRPLTAYTVSIEPHQGAPNPGREHRHDHHRPHGFHRGSPPADGRA